MLTCMPSVAVLLSRWKQTKGRKGVKFLEKSVKLSSYHWERVVKKTGVSRGNREG